MISFVLTTYDVQTAQVGRQIGTALRNGADFVFTPIQQVASGVTRPIVGFVDGVANLARLREQNEDLRDEVAALEQQVADGESVAAELEELQKINNLITPSGIDTVTARVYGVGPSGFDNIRAHRQGLERRHRSRDAGGR